MEIIYNQILLKYIDKKNRSYKTCMFLLTFDVQSSLTGDAILACRNSILSYYVLMYIYTPTYV